MGRVFFVVTLSAGTQLGAGDKVNPSDVPDIEVGFVLHVDDGKALEHEGSDLAFLFVSVEVEQLVFLAVLYSGDAGDVVNADKGCLTFRGELEGESLYATDIGAHQLVPIAVIEVNQGVHRLRVGDIFLK